MTDQAINPKSQAESISGASQPHSQDQPVSLRLRRSRSSPDENTINLSLQHRILSPSSRSSSVKTESSGLHTGASSKRPSPKMPSSDTSAQSSLTSPRYTKTGRVSKAKKGIRGAHVCVCGKVYSRAEHLRRHKQNHETQLPCPLPSCGKLFHRQDLLDRHLATKHSSSSNTMDPIGSPSNSGGSSYGASSGILQQVVSSVEPVPTLAHSSISVSAQQPNTFLSATSHESISPTTREEPSIKNDTLSYRPQYNTSWVGLGASVDPSQNINVGAVSDYSSSGEHSPFNPDPFFTSLSGDLETLYPPHNTFEAFWLPTNASSPHLSGWNEMEPPSIPASVASSPASTYAALPPVILPQGHNGVPYPLPWIVQRDRYGTLDLEGLLEDQHLGVCLSLKTKQHYIDAYWKNFHPLFPVLHKYSYRSQSPSPLLGAAVMAIGAQYTDEQFAKGDSRILHEKCLELITKYKQTLRTTRRLDYMQAIFLVELFSHFKAKRAASTLSDIFMETYEQLEQEHHNTTRSRFNQLATVGPHSSDVDLQRNWTDWIRVHAFERLLTACYILESQQALLLVRSTQTSATLGLDLFMPARTAAWEANSCLRWAQLMRHDPVPISNVEQVLDSIMSSETEPLRFEPFESSLLIACHAASVVSMKQAPYMPANASHQLFEIEHTSTLQTVLCPHPNVQIMHHAVVLASVTPLRALLATSGESWVLSQRLSHDALLAATEFDTLKTELHTWTNNLQPPAFFWTNPAATNPSLEALHQALSILQLALDTDAKNLAFGSEMALYYASLVLWSATLAAVKKAEATGLKFETDDTAEFEAPRAEHDARYFVRLAQSELTSLVGDCIPSTEGIDRWRFGVGAVLRWSAWVVGGAGMRSSGVGELMEGAVGVLERLGRSGWMGDWF